MRGMLRDPIRASKPLESGSEPLERDAKPLARVLGELLLALKPYEMDDKLTVAQETTIQASRQASKGSKASFCI